MSGLKWRLVTPCPHTHLGRTCEGEAGHSGDHWVTVWAVEQVDDNEWDTYPSYPEYWSAEEVSDV